MPTYLDFEQPIAELEGKIEELRHLPNAGDLNIAEEVARLQQKADKLLRQTYGKLSPWQKTLVARHIDRPHFSDYVAGLLEDYTPLAGDRLYADDRAIQGGLGRFRGRSVLVLGHEKGTATTRMQYNWGMAKPEGYRKAQRLMETADRFNLPLLVFVDTPGAYPGVEAEARGQAEAIARSIEVCLKIRVPFIATVIGEGGSGGAIALAAANRVMMMEHAVYSVISPEGCAAILWRSRDEGKEAAAEALKLTAQDLLGLGIIDQIVPEPLGGAHRGKADAVNALGDALERSLGALTGGTVRDFRADRRGKFLSMGRKGLA